MRYFDFSLGITPAGKDWTQSMTSSYSKTAVFVFAHANDKPAKIFPPGTVFEILSFLVPESTA